MRLSSARCIFVSKPKSYLLAQKLLQYFFAFSRECYIINVFKLQCSDLKAPSLFIRYTE